MLIAAIEESAVIVKILTHLGLPTLVNVASSAPILRPFDLRLLPPCLNGQPSNLTATLWRQCSGASRPAFLASLFT